MITSLLVTLFFYQWIQICISLWVHRSTTHRALDTHPILQHIFRFSLWCTHKIMQPENWLQRYAAKHRIHHLYSDTKQDHQSPRNYALKELLDFSKAHVPGSANYVSQSDIQKYAPDVKTPNDWIERNLYKKYPNLGRYTTEILLLVWLGWWGLLPVIFIEFSPILSILIFNVWPHTPSLGYTHSWMSKELRDDSRNLFPVGFLHLGDELHQNHHMYPNSISNRVYWYEFDLGYIYIKLFSYLGLMTNLQPTPRSGKARRYKNENSTLH